MDLSTQPDGRARSAAIPHYDDPHRDDGIVSRSPALCDALERLERIAPIDTTVLITGETGTGKELMPGVCLPQFDEFCSNSLRSLSCAFGARSRSLKLQRQLLYARLAFFRR